MFAAAAPRLAAAPAVFGDRETVVDTNALVHPDGRAFASYCIAMRGSAGVDADHPDRDAFAADVLAEAERRVAARGGTLREPEGFSVTVARR